MSCFISIIVPVFRVEQYLRDCLDSLLTQQGDGYEVVAVNDCSPDGSSSILQEFKQRYPHLTVIEFAQNRGVSAARNAGIDAAKGDWLMFCDSDDVLCPGTIPLLKEEIRNRNCELITFGLKRVNDVAESTGLAIDGNVVLHDMEDEFDATTFVSKNFPHCLWAWNKCFRRDLIGDLRFHDYQPCEDAVFTLDCMIRAKKILELPNICYKYLQHEGSCLKTVSRKRIYGDIQGMQELAEVLCRWQFFHAVRRFAYCQLRDVFLHSIAIRIRQCKESREVISQLKRLYFDSAKRVFVELPISPGCAKLFYRILFVFRSVFVVHATLAIRRRVLGALRLRKGLG